MADSPVPDDIRYERLDPYLAWEFPETMRVEVRRTCSCPIPDAAVRLKLEAPDGTTVFEKEYRTGPDCTVEIPLAEHRGKRFRSFRLEIDKDSLVPAVFLRTDAWQSARTDLYQRRTHAAPVRIPEQLTVTLKTGEYVPLEFVDPQGKPVAGAQVVVGIVSNAEFQTDGVFLRENPPRSEYRTNTHEGKCVVGPVDFEAGYPSLRVSCPGFQDFVGHLKKQPLEAPAGSGAAEVPEVQWRRYTLRPLAMPEEIFVLEGRVLDVEGKPIAGALLPGGISDENGRYRAELPIRDGKVVLTAYASGMKRDAVTLDPKTVSSPFDVTLQPGTPIRIQAVDEQGSPVTFIDASPVIQEVPGLQGCVFPNTHGNSCWETCDVASDEIFLAVHYTGAPKDGKTFRSEKPYYACRPRLEPYVVRMIAEEAPPPKPEPPQEFAYTIPLRVAEPRDHSWKLPDRIAFRLRDFETGEPCDDVHLTVTLDVRTDIPDSRMLMFSSRMPSDIAKIQFAVPDAKTDARGLVGIDFGEFNADAVMEVSFLFQRKGYSPKRLTWRSGDIGPFYSSIATPASQLRRMGVPVPEFLDLVLVREESK